MNTFRILFQLFLIMAFVAGIYVCLYDIVIEQETFTDNKQEDDSCPNLLIKKEGKLLLYNTNKLK